MINFKYNIEENLYFIGFNKLHFFDKEELPLKAEFRKMVNLELSWTSNLNPGAWTKWNGGSCKYNAYVYTANGELIFEKIFDVELFGNQIEKTFHYYIEANPNSNGLIIGPHDGTFGHWTYDLINNKDVNIVFVEGTQDRFETLEKNYPLLNATYINEIVTPTGEDVIWYKGGEGFTDTVNRNVIKKYLKDDQIKMENRQSISINKLIEENFIKKHIKFDWLHLDVEGIDCELILALKYFPNVIIFETAHTNKTKYFEILDWMSQNNYELYNDGSDAIAIRKN